MAEKKVIEIEVKSKQANQAIKDLTKSATDLTASFEDVYGEIQPLSGRMGELEDRMYELSLAGKQNTQEFKDLEKEVGKYKRVIQETDRVVDAISTTTGQKLGLALEGAAQGFALTQGAMGLFGAESQEVEEALLKVQSAMAIAQGVEGVRQAIPVFKSLGSTINDTFKGLKGALLASGIGAFVVLLGAVAAYWDEISEAIGGAKTKQDAYNETLEDYKKGATDAILKTQQVKSAFDLAKQGVISKEEALQTYNDTLGDAFGKATTLAQAEELYNSKQDAYVKAMAKRARANVFFQKSAELAAEAITSSQEDQTTFFDKVGVAFKSFGKSYDQTNKELLVIQEKRNKENEKKKLKEAKLFEDLAILETKGAETTENAVGIKSEAEIKLENDRKSRADAQKQRADEELNQLKEYIKQAQKFNEDSARTAQEKELNDVAEKYKIQLDLAKKYNKDATDILNAQKQEENDINLKYEQERQAIIDESNKQIADAEKQRLFDIAQNQEDFDAQYYEATQSATQLEINAVNEKYFTLIETAKQYGYDTIELEKKQAEELDAIRKTSTEKELANQKALQDAKFNLAKQGLSVISDIADLFAKKDEASARKAFKIKKAASIATAIVDTYQGASSAFAQTPGGIGIKTIAAGVATASGLARVAAIAKTKFEGGGSSAPSVGGGGSDGGGGSVQAPNFNIVGNNGQNQLAQLTQQPIQAYVVSSEVTSAQALDRNRIQNATL
jgi:hypothetical protein